MKAKLIRRISTFLLVTTMMFVLSFTTFAVEYKTNDEISDTSGNVTSEEVVPLAVGTPVRGTVQPKDTLYLYPELYSYVGFQRTFYLSTSSTQTWDPSGNVYIYLYKPNGDLLDAWNMGANAEVYRTYNLPSSGKYKVEVKNEVREAIVINCTWTTNKG